MKTRANRLVSMLLAGALCLSLLAACAPKKKELTRYSTIFYDVFDTVTQVIAYCESEEVFKTQMDALHADLVTYNQLYDIYNDYPGVTNVKTINDNAGKAPVEVDDRILSMLELADQMYATTNGKLNIAMGSVLNIWHNYREAAEASETDADNKLPSMDELEAAAQHCDINNVIIDEDAKTVYLADPDMRLDVGSVGKGYAVEMACQAAEARGLTSALVSVGGNLRAIGTKPDGSQWTGGVENPWNASDLYTASSMLSGAINMSDMALVTSGDYQRYFVVDGQRYHHLIDPDTPVPFHLLQWRDRAVQRLRSGRLPDHRPVLPAAGGRAEDRGKSGRRGGHVVHTGSADHYLLRLGCPFEKLKAFRQKEKHCNAVLSFCFKIRSARNSWEWTPFSGRLPAGAAPSGSPLPRNTGSYTRPGRN